MYQSDQYSTKERPRKVRLEKAPLAPYVAHELRVMYGEEWWDQGVLRLLYDDHRRELPAARVMDYPDRDRLALRFEQFKAAA